jgi:TPR repeat protein
MYHSGGGVERDPTRAVQLLEQGCEWGEIKACNDAGLAQFGDAIVTSQMSRALALFERGCDGGDPTACQNLGDVYETGMGLPINKVRARALYARACTMGAQDACQSPQIAAKTRVGNMVHEMLRQCDGGEPSACRALGLVYEHGWFVRADRNRARTFKLRACKLGVKQDCPEGERP